MNNTTVKDYQDILAPYKSMWMAVTRERAK